MVLAMPNQGQPLAGLFAPDTVKEILDYTRWKYGEVTDEDGVLRAESSAAQVILPKFTFTRDLDMIPALRALGVQTAFDGRADFSGMDEKNGLYLGAVKQKTFIDVNEEKTVAISINLGGMNKAASAAPALVPEVVFDRPFLFAIVDSAGLPLFLGVVNNPAE